jgi:hypothetical protein
MFLQYWQLVEIFTFVSSFAKEYLNRSRDRSLLVYCHLGGAYASTLLPLWPIQMLSSIAIKFLGVGCWEHVGFSHFLHLSGQLIGRSQQIKFTESILHLGYVYLITIFSGKLNNTKPSLASTDCWGDMVAKVRDEKWTETALQSKLDPISYPLTCTRASYGHMRCSSSLGEKTCSRKLA